MSEPFAPKQIVHVHVQGTKIDKIKRAIKKPFSETQLLVENIVSLALNNTIQEISAWINTYVPKDTGALRADLIKFLSTSTIKKKKGLFVSLILGSVMPYIKYINKMGTYGKPHVRHSNKDPKAIGKFWGKMILYARQRFRDNIKKARNEVVEGINKKPFSDKIKVINN